MTPEAAERSFLLEDGRAGAGIISKGSESGSLGWMRLLREGGEVGEKRLEAM